MNRSAFFSRKEKIGCSSLLIIIGCVLLIGFIIGSFCWTYAINTWLVFAQKETAITWLQGGLIGLIPGIGHAGIVVAFVTWIIMLFLK
jgi:TRAP-type C4-dicarboxylate transport system permease small subunit